MCNWKETTWHAGRFRVQRIESARDTQPIRGVKPSDGMACMGVQALSTPSSRKKIWEEEVLTLNIYVSSSISQLTTNSGPFRAWNERYFCKKWVSFVHYRWLCFRLYMYESIQHKSIKSRRIVPCTSQILQNFRFTHV